MYVRLGSGYISTCILKYLVTIDNNLNSLKTNMFKIQAAAEPEMRLSIGNHGYEKDPYHNEL